MRIFKREYDYIVICYKNKLDKHYFHLTINVITRYLTIKQTINRFLLHNRTYNSFFIHKVKLHQLTSQQLFVFYMKYSVSIIIFLFLNTLATVLRNCRSQNRQYRHRNQGLNILKGHFHRSNCHVGSFRGRGSTARHDGPQRDDNWGRLRTTAT